MDYADRTETVAVGCAATPNRPADVISDTRTEYDGGAFGAAPDQGQRDPDRTAAVLHRLDPDYQMVSTRPRYDSAGPAARRHRRPRNYATTTAYTPATRRPADRTTVTNALSQVTTTTVSPAWGSTTVGRRRQQQTHRRGLRRARPARQRSGEPTRSKASNQNPNINYVYTVSNTAPSTSSPNRSTTTAPPT